MRNPGFRADVSHDRASAIATVTVTGDVDLASVNLLESARDRALSGSPSQLLIDLREVRFVDSSGLKFLLETNRLSKSGGWRLQLLKPSESVMRPFVLTGVEKHLPFVEPGQDPPHRPD
jgi:anti-anti-sigma factor